MKTLAQSSRTGWKRFLQGNLYLILTSAFCLFFLAVSIQATPGDIDLAFGGGGRVLSPFTQEAQSYIVLIQGDGKIIIGGGGILGRFASLRDFALVRYHPNGLIDTSFGINGIVLTDMKASQFAAGPDWITDAALLPDGKIVVVGSAAYDYGAPIPGSAFGIARYLPNGALDNSFSDDGRVFFFGANAVPAGVEVQQDGKILVAGKTDCVKCSSRFMIVRLNSDGTTDTSFGGGPVISTFTQAGESTIEALALQPDGKIIIAGENRSPYYYAIASYTTDGTRDTTFGVGGVVSIPVATLGRGTNMIAQPEGKIVIIGDRTWEGNSRDFVLLRFDPDGTPDSSFGDNGRVVTAVSDLADMPWHVVYQPDGKLIVTGQSFDANNSTNRRAVLVRYNPDGSIDPTFGDGGIVFTPNYTAAFRSALQPDGKIVTTNGGFSMIRYHGDTPYLNPRRDFDFTGDGLTDFAVARNIEGQHHWYVGSNPALELVIDQEWGVATDKIVPADYDGDGKTDVAVFREGAWFILQSSNNTLSALSFGMTNDIPVPFDYTGDRRAELAVYRGGIWYLLDLSNDQFQALQFGISSDRPVPADYDGDGKTDIAVYRDGVWYWSRSSDNGFGSVQFGIASDRPVVGDYDGDGRVDQAVYRSGVWYILGSAQGYYAVQFGLSSDIPVAADYDGDGKTDVAVFRDGVWYMLRSQQGFSAVQFGLTNDLPIHAAFVP